MFCRRTMTGAMKTPLEKPGACVGGRERLSCLFCRICWTLRMFSACDSWLSFFGLGSRGPNWLFLPAWPCPGRRPAWPARGRLGAAAGLALLLAGALSSPLGLARWFSRYLAQAQRLFGRSQRAVFHHHVGHYALGLDRAAVGREVARGGQLDAAGVAQRHDGLHRALAEGLGADQHRALVVPAVRRRRFPTPRPSRR